MNSTLIQSKEKKFWEKIYYNYIQSNDLKSGEKRSKNFFVSLHYAFGWKYICHYSKHRVNLKKKTLLGAGLVFFLFNSEIFFVRPMEIFLDKFFLYLCWSKLLKEFFLLWSIVVVSWYQALSTLKNQTKLRVIFWLGEGIWKQK